MRFSPSPKLIGILAMTFTQTCWGNVIEVDFDRPTSFPNGAKCKIEVFVDADFCTSEEVGQNEGWHATMQYAFGPTQKKARAVFSVVGAVDWIFRRREVPFTIDDHVGLGTFKPELREKVISNALKESRDVTGSQNTSLARIENAKESLEEASTAVTTNKEKIEILVEWNDLAAVSNASTTFAKKFVMSELPRLHWKGLNAVTRKSIFIAASGVAEKFTQQKGGRRNKFGLYGEAADTIPEAAELWDAVTSAYAKVNPEYAAAIANPSPEKLTKLGSERAFKEQVFRTFLYGSKK